MTQDPPKKQQGLALNSFKILTPSEITYLLETAEAAKVSYGIVDDDIVSTNIFGADEIVQTTYQAKIIPITAKKRVKKSGGGIATDGNAAMKLEEVSVEQEYENLSPGELEKIGILSWEKIKKLKEREKEKREKALPSSSAFLLDALSGTKHSNCKLSKSSAISTYKKNSSFTKSAKDDDKPTIGDKGSLIDKDQH